MLCASDMHYSIPVVCMVVALLSVVDARPAEVAEMPQKSPVDIIVETKDNFGFDLIQKRLINALHPKPIVDTITEEEKYGNHVDHAFGRKITKAVEGLSNAVNTVFRIPEDAAKRGSIKLTDFLDNIGGKLVGLQK